MTERIRVARIVTRLNVGGPARHVRILHEKLDPRRFDSHLFIGTTDPNEGTLEFKGENITRVPDLRRPIDVRQDLRAYEFIAARLREEHPHIVHTHLAKAGTLGRYASIRSDVPLKVHTFHGHVLEAYFSPLKSRAFVQVERWLARRTDALVAVSSAVRDELLDLGIGTAEQWHVVPLGLDLRPLLTRQISPQQARRNLGLPDTGPTVGIVGRLVPIKDHETFLRAAQRVAASRSDVSFVVAGDGELRSSLEARANATLGGRIQWLGWVKDLPTLYAALDVVVLTSRNEGTPVALIEAAAAGRPVVATAVGGVRDVVLDGRTGLLTEARDDPGIAQRIQQIIEDPHASKMGALAREWVRERFSAERLLADIEALYDELLSTRC